MKYRVFLALGLLVAFVAGAWMALRPPEYSEATAAAEPAASAPAARAAMMVGPTKLGAAAVLSIDPRANPLKSAAAVVRASLHGEFLAAKQYRPLYDRLKSTPEGQTREGMYVLYEMLQRCATVTERTTRRPLVRTNEQKRDEFLAGIPANDPMRDKRIAAFDDVAANRCVGMEGIAITQADLNKLLSDAAAMGDPKAQAAALEQALWQERRASGPQGRWGRDSVTLSDAQVDSLRQIAATRDPEAMMIAGRVLASSWHDFSLRIGPDSQLVEPRAFQQAFALLACDYGYPCGDTNPRVLSGCAYQGHCDAANLADYLFYYGSSPHDSQLLAQYRGILRQAVETGDWSQVTVARGPRPPGAPVAQFGPGGR
jgi:hypothetical protein